MKKIPNIQIAIKPIINVIQEKPIFAIFEACLRCNSACQYCDLPLNQKRYEMSRNQIREVFSSLYEDGLRFVLVQGGEPLVRRDIAEILEDLAEIGFNLSLVTNGTLLTPQLVERFSRLSMHISVSLDTLDRERYHIIRGKDQLPQVLNAINALANFSGSKSIVCIVSKINQNDVIDVTKFAKERGFIPIIGAYHSDIGKYGKVSDELAYQKQSAIAIFDSVLKSNLVPQGYYRDYVKDNIKWLSNESLEPCDAGRFSIVIDASGNVSPCLAHDSVGNLLELPLNEILAKFNYQEIKQCSDSSACNLLCARVVGKNLRHPTLGLNMIYSTLN